jgi:hypothetical protein
MFGLEGVLSMLTDVIDYCEPKSCSTQSDALISSVIKQ